MEHLAIRCVLGLVHHYPITMRYLKREHFMKMEFLKLSELSSDSGGTITEKNVCELLNTEIVATFVQALWLLREYNGWSIIDLCSLMRC